MTPAIVEMEITSHKLTKTIVDGGSRVKVLPKQTWKACKALGKPTLWSLTFHLIEVDLHGIKPHGTLMAQKVTVGTQHFFLDFVVISLAKRGYDALLGRERLITVKDDHN